MKDLRDHITCISGRRRVDTQGEVPTKCCIDPSQVCWTIMIPHKRSNLQSLDRHCRERLQDSLSVLPPCVYLMSGWYYPGTSHQHTWQNLPGLPPLYLHIYQKWPNTGGGEGLEMRLHHVAVLVTLWEVLHWGKKMLYCEADYEVALHSSQFRVSSTTRTLTWALQCHRHSFYGKTIIMSSAVHDTFMRLHSASIQCTCKLKEALGRAWVSPTLVCSIEILLLSYLSYVVPYIFHAVI